MQEEIYAKLYNSRFLSDNSEIESFERCLNLLSETFTAEDIGELCSVFADDTKNVEVMFGAVHLLETLSSETAFENTIKGVVEMSYTSPEWAKIIIYRCLNDEFSVRMINTVKNRLDNKSGERFRELLMSIKAEDKEQFSRVIDMML